MLIEINGALKEISSSKSNPEIDAIVSKIELLLSLKDSQLIEKYEIRTNDPIYYRRSYDKAFNKRVSPKHTSEKSLSEYYLDKSLLAWAEILITL